MGASNKIIVSMEFGSVLYGTNTPQSDTDYMGVFLEDTERVLLGRIRGTIVDHTGDDQSKNTKDDVDTDWKELQKFLYDAMAGQTYAMDMLFAPEKFHNRGSWIWDEVIHNREKLLSRNVKPFIGYCRQQAGKYGLKGSRLGELERVISVLEKERPSTKLQDVDVGETEFVKWVELKGVPYLDVLGKKFDRLKLVKFTLGALQAMHDKYGARSKLAQQNDGIDWKAISHAYRCMYELQELLTTKHITFPLPQAKYLLELKQGRIPYSQVQDELPALMEEVTNAPTELPEEPDRKFWDQFIVVTRLEHL